MDLKIEYLPLKALKPYERNARKHGKEDVEAVAACIRETGFNDPIGIWSDKNIIVEGHGRLLAAKKLGMKEVPCIRLDHLTDEQRKAYALAHNKTAELSSWDVDLLNLELEDITDIDMEQFGFDLPDPLADMEAVDDDYEISVPEQPKAKYGEIYQLGRHRLMCGDSTVLGDVQKLVENVQMDLLITDPPYNVDYEGTAGKIKNDSMKDDKFREFLTDAFKNAAAVMKPGASFYIWHADSEGYNFRQACFNAGWQVRQCLIWNKNSLVLGRQDYQWKHEPCQPAGTMVMTPSGEKPIEDLTEDDRVVSYYTMQNELHGLRDGTEIQTASREYVGTLYGICGGGKETWATNNHEFSVKFNPKTANAWCTYLMRRGKWWRVGCTRTYDARGFGLKHRVDQEKADEAWLINAYETQSDAQIHEQILAVMYGIPYTHWEVREGTTAQRTEKQINQLYEAFDLDAMKDRAVALLKANHRDPQFPLVSKETKTDRFSRRVTARINACNLIPGLMNIPVVEGKKVTFIPIEKVENREYNGTVYSLAVRYYEHYVADGIVTHNCLYGWKEGAGHQWHNDRKQTTVMDYDRPKKNAEHPTMKPVPLFDYEIRNSTKEGDLVLDLFGGSGTTIMACEQDGRNAYVMELDPKYVDVIIDRYEAFTGGKAVLLNGEEGQTEG